MALIPRYQQRTSVPLGGQARPQLNLPGGDDFRLAANVVSAAGGAIGDFQQLQAQQEAAAKREEAARLKQEEEDGKAWAVPLVAQANLDIGSGWYEAQGAVPDSGAGLADDVQRRVAETYAPLKQAATTPAAKAQVEEAERAAMAAWVPKAREKEFDTRNAWRANQGEVALNTGIASINAAQSTDEVDLLFGQQVAAIQPLYSSIEDPQARSKATLAAVQKMADAAYVKRQTLGAALTNEVPAQGVVGPVADAIRAEAASQGQNADVLLTIAALENPTGDPRIKNPVSSATGIFQHTGKNGVGTWYDLGGTDKDRLDPMRQIQLGVKLTAQNRATLKASFGREPTGGELYLAHQQGIGGARALLNAGPGMSAIDALVPAYNGNRARATEAVVNNGGSVGMTAAQFVNKWQRKFDAAAAGGAVTRLATPEGRKAGDTAAAKVVQDKKNLIIGQLDIAVDNGTATRNDLDSAVKSGLVKEGDPDHVRLSKAIQTVEEKARKEAEEKATATALVEGALFGGIPIDPTDAKAKNAVDADYVERAATWAPGEKAGRAIEYSNRVGFLPDPVRGTIIGGLRSSDPGKRLEAAQFYGRLRATNPSLVNSLPGDVALDANYLIEAQRKGMTSKEAIESLSMSEKMTPDDIKARDKAFSTALGPKQNVATSTIENLLKNDKAIKDERNLWQTVGTQGRFIAPPEMQADIIFNATRAYRRTGDIESSLQTGYDQARRVWGPSVINGEPRMMKNAPEVIYGVPEMNATDNAKWMREQAAKEFGLNKPAELRFLEAIGVTTREGRPAYYLMRETDQGVTPVTKNGKPVAWVPQWQSSPEKGRRDKERADKNAEKLRVAKIGRAGYVDTMDDPKTLYDAMQVSSEGGPP